MTVTNDDIKRTATLARVRIEENEIPAYVGHLNNLLKLVEDMNKIDTTNIEPMSHPMEGQTQRFREDSVTEKDQRAHFQKNAPHVAEGLYIVPKVIE